MPRGYRRIEWTPLMLEQLRAQFGKISAPRLADRLGVSHMTVYKKAEELGLHRPKVQSLRAPAEQAPPLSGGQLTAGLAPRASALAPRASKIVASRRTLTAHLRHPTSRLFTHHANAQD